MYAEMKKKIVKRFIEGRGDGGGEGEMLLGNV